MPMSVSPISPSISFSSTASYTYPVSALPRFQGGGTDGSIPKANRLARIVTWMERQSQRFDTLLQRPFIKKPLQALGVGGVGAGIGALADSGVASLEGSAGFTPVITTTLSVVGLLAGIVFPMVKKRRDAAEAAKAKAQ